HQGGVQVVPRAPLRRRGLGRHRLQLRVHGHARRAAVRDAGLRGQETDMHITQGTFSYLPPLTDEQIKAQIQYCIDNWWATSVEFTDDPPPRNFLWDMWELPMFDLKDPSAILLEINRCREAYPHHYIRFNAYDRSLGRQTTALSFIVNRPPEEPG